MQAENPLPDDDAELATWLAAVDEALAAGALPPALPANGSAGGTLRERGQACLQLLQHLRPPHGEPRASQPSRVEPELPRAGARFGRYQLVREVGRGTFGLVYLAHDGQLNRHVALKIARGTVLTDPDMKARFDQEARAAAGLDHPHIVQVYESGTIDGCAYIASAFVAGSTLSQWLQRRALPVPAREAARMLLLLTEAVTHAHQRGIVHRDLKPANILLVDAFARNDGGHGSTVAAAPGQPIPKIADFGLAKTVGHATQTATGVILGTPSYMAPEQARGDNTHVTFAADIYSLGAVLYEVLTGRPPFVAETAMEVIELVRREEPLPPSRLRPGLPRDLDTICLKCLQKEPAARYADAQALAEDLRRFLDDRPLLARPVGRLERGWRWCRRNPVLAALEAALLVTFLAGAAGIVWQWRAAVDEAEQKEAALGVALGETELKKKALALALAESGQKEQALRREEQERQAKEASLHAANDNLYLVSLSLAQREWQAHRLDEARKYLEQCPAEPRDWEWHYFHRLLHAPLAAIKTPNNMIRALAYNPEGTLLAGGNANGGDVRLWDPATRRPQAVLKTAFVSTMTVAFSPNGKTLAIGGVSPKKGPSGIEIWNVDKRERIATLPGHAISVLCLAFEPGSNRIISCGADGKILISRIDLGAVDVEIPDDGIKAQRLAVSPDGQWLAWCGRGFVARGSPDRVGVVKLWNLRTGKLERSWQAARNSVDDISFSLDGKYLASSGDRSLRVWDVASGLELFVREGGPRCLFGPGNILIANDISRITRVWKVPSGLEIRAYRGQTDYNTALAISPDGKQLASACNGLKVVFRDLTLGEETRGLNHGGGQLLSLSVQGEWVATVSRSQARHWLVNVWNVATGKLHQPIVTGLEDLSCVALSPDCRWLALGGGDKRAGFVAVWDMQTMAPRHHLQNLGDAVAQVAFSPDSQFLACVGQDGALRVWNVETGKLRWQPAGHDGALRCLAWSPDGRWLACGGQNRQIKLWDAASGKVIRAWQAHNALTTGVAFHPKGTTLASGGYDKVVQLWDPATGEARGTIKGLGSEVNCLAYSPDGKRLVVGCALSIKLLDPVSCREVLTLAGTRPWTVAVAFDTAGRLIAGDSGDTLSIYERD